MYRRPFLLPKTAADDRLQYPGMNEGRRENRPRTYNKIPLSRVTRRIRIERWCRRRHRAEELRREINAHNHSYYALDDSTTSDAEYDRLLQELRGLESDHPDLLTPDSPTQRVGGAPAEGFTQVMHSAPILSLANASNRDDLENWLRRTKSLVDDAEFDLVCEFKIDGLAVNLTYETGVSI